jgi:uncharacterized protein YjbI with pentapeptide repeats
MRRFLSRQDKVFSHPVILAAFVAGFISLMQLQVLMGLETWRLDRQLEVEGHANRASLLQDYFDDMERIVPGERGLLGLDPDPALAALANARTRVAFREQEESDYGREIILEFIYDVGLIDNGDATIELLGVALLDLEMFDQDFSGSDFRGAWLSKSGFGSSSFNSSDLSGATLAYTFLEETSFKGANLSQTALNASWLRRVDFSRANLQSALLAHTDLREANFRDALLRNADFYCADLRGAQNLDSIDLEEAYRLRYAVLPDGSMYDGRFRLPGDIEMAVLAANKDTPFARGDKFMADFYGVSMDEYTRGQEWADSYLHNHPDPRHDPDNPVMDPHPIVDLRRPWKCDLNGGGQNPPFELLREDQ